MQSHPVLSRCQFDGCCRVSRQRRRPYEHQNLERKPHRPFDNLVGPHSAGLLHLCREETEQ